MYEVTSLDIRRYWRVCGTLFNFFIEYQNHTIVC